jgi:general secretion pathway protein C
MDIAQSLADLRQLPPEQWLHTANRLLPSVCVAVLILVIARQLATLTWMVVAEPATDSGAVIVRTVDSGTRSGPDRSYSPLSGWRPFGDPPDDAAVVAIEAILDAPDTTLNLELYGVHEATDVESGRPLPDQGTAIISSGSAEQEHYTVGETINRGSGARLHSVYYDRVLLDRGGRLETLRLPLEVAASVTRPAGGQNLFARPTAAASSPSLQTALSQNAVALSDIIRPTPNMDSGQMIGFTLSPGRNRDAFNALGLQPGDVMTEVNGLVMNDPQSIAKVFSALSETTVASVTILRNGNPQVLTIDMSLVESIMENSQ